MSRRTEQFQETRSTTEGTPEPRQQPPSDTRTGPAQAGPVARAVHFLLTERVALLGVLLIVLLIWMKTLDFGGYLIAPYDSTYLGANLDSMVPVCLLALAELVVMVAGRGGIDLSVGGIVSLAGMAFGYLYGIWHWPLLPALAVTVLLGGLLGALNGFLIAYLRFPALIATLAAGYAFGSIALSLHNSDPISTERIQNLSSITHSSTVPGLESVIPPFPAQVLTFMLPTAVVLWLLINLTTFGRRLYGVGTNETAAHFAGVSVRRLRFRAYATSGLLSGLVAVLTVAQFASARPDAGSAGNGMALPAITIAVLGGVAVSGGIGRVGGVVLAALLVTWLNTGILLMFNTSEGGEYQMLALGAVLLLSALLNSLTMRSYGSLR
ncbi:ABC transporter permease [Streptomyces canus]|uniref:ABC transporter permease n=1 Tax=Streptomyces canus TaxID=58343 RepID=UPI002788B5A9|nr:ABC transporter permease [Streptomyces canus]MDQ0765524.1 ribose/xylose/arabinose/galactoside ABC-type transport system permease subunit [Streptomyces canus]